MKVAALQPYAGAPLKWPGLLLGFAPGSFFDGILLHRILQRHHLLSGVDVVRDMRVPVLADGLFLAAMYVVTAVALVRLGRRCVALAIRNARRILPGNALMGFGIWHMVDGMISHWLTGIHRIGPDAGTSWVWDLLRFFVLGVLPTVAGWCMLRQGGGPGRGGPTAAAALGLAVLVAGPLRCLTEARALPTGFPCSDAARDPVPQDPDPVQMSKPAHRPHAHRRSGCLRETARSEGAHA